MTFPDDLPGVLVYLLGVHHGHDIVKATYPRRPVAFVSSSGSTDAAMICPTIPYGCQGWRLLGETGWKPLDALPPHWRPFLSRERGTEHDPRMPFCPQCGDVTGTRGQKCPRCVRKEQQR